MNSLNDLLNQKADEMFTSENTPPTTITTTAEPQIEPNIDYSELKDTIYQIKDQLDQILRKINKQQVDNLKQTHPDDDGITDDGERIIEGVFNGLVMIGSDSKEYTIPPNYASKSKLVEGDLMKLTITNKGTFVYKQIGPIERRRLIGELTLAGEQYAVNVEGKNYFILTASVTFFKGKPGDEAVILVPKDGTSEWAALENIIHK